MAYDMAEVSSAYMVLSKLVKADLDAEFTANRIKSTEYADVYNSLMGTALGLSIDVPIKGTNVENLLKDLELKDEQIANLSKDLESKDKDMELKAEQIANLEKDLLLKDEQITNLSKDGLIKDEQVNLTAAQTETQIRQKEGFDDDLRRKMLDIQMNTWAMMFSSGLLDEKPKIITDDEVSDLYCYMKEQVLEEPYTASASDEDTTSN